MEERLTDKEIIEIIGMMEAHAKEILKGAERLRLDLELRDPDHVSKDHAEASDFDARMARILASREKRIWKST